MHSLIIRFWAVVCLAWLAPAAAMENGTLVLIRLQADAAGAKLPLYRAWQAPTIRAHGVSTLGRPYIFERLSLSLRDYKSGWAEVILEPGIYDVAFNSIVDANPVHTIYTLKVLPDTPVLYVGSAVTKCDKQKVNGLKADKYSCGNFDFIDESALAAHVYGGSLVTTVLGEPDSLSSTKFRSAYNLIEENGVSLEMKSSALPTAYMGGTERKYSKASKFGMAMAVIALAPVLMLAPSIAELPLKKGKNIEETLQAQACLDELHEKTPMNEYFNQVFKLVDNIPSANPAVLNISPQNILLRECSDGFLCFETEIRFALLERKFGYNLYNKTLSYSSDPGRWGAFISSKMLGGDGGQISSNDLCSEAGVAFMKSEYTKAMTAMAEKIRSDLQVVRLAPN